MQRLRERCVAIELLNGAIHIDPPRVHAALAVRRRDGKIEVLDREVQSRYPQLVKLPLLRGFFILWDMNFEMAAELCQARGIDVQAVVINDDVAVQDSLYTAGRRGVGATVLAEKICGAAAARGYDLGRVAALARRVNDCARSMNWRVQKLTLH